MLARVKLNEMPRCKIKVKCNYLAERFSKYLHLKGKLTKRALVPSEKDFLRIAILHQFNGGLCA